MTVFRCLLVLAMLLPVAAQAGGNDNPILALVTVEEAEWREGDEFVWDAEGWIGKDRDKLWWRTEGETSSEATEEFETQLLYSRAVSRFWDLQAGWRGDWQPGSNRSWFAFGATGVAPGFIHTEITGFLADGRSSARIKARYDLFLSQYWVLVPRVEANWYGSEDVCNGIGRGFSELELDLRLLWRIRPNFLPYAGVAWSGLYAGTADLAEASGEKTRDLQALVGLSVWF